MNTYLDVSWNPEDLVSSKQAVYCLLIQGVSEEDILDLDFGNLNVTAIIEEFNYVPKD